MVCNKDFMLNSKLAAFSFWVSAVVISMDIEISAQRVRCGRFILATNILNSRQFTANDALREYKAQQISETFKTSCIKGSGFLRINS